MSRSDRLFYAAFVGLAVAGAAPPQKQAVGAQTADQVSPTPTPTNDYAPYPDKDADRCYQAKNHDSADLCAQWRAAIAAEKAADSTYWGNVVGGIGAALSFLSVVLVIAALRQTERSLKESMEANDIASQTAKRQLRAYVMAEDQTIDGLWRGGPTTMTLKVYNRGQTPAYNVRVWSVVTGTLENPDQCKIFRRAGEKFHQSTIDVGPGNFVVHGNDCQDPLDGNAYSGIVAGDLKLIFAGVIKYEDAFGRTRRTTFKQFYAGNGNSATITSDLSACGRGNRSS